MTMTQPGSSLQQNGRWEKWSVSSFALHVLAMAVMLCDHLWATMFPWREWLTCIGRLAFPIFAFMIVEGYFRTKNVRRYPLRLLAFAVISEVPFDLIYGSRVIYPYHQNVLWTYLMGLLLIVGIERVRKKGKLWQNILVSAAAVAVGLLAGTVTMVDFYGVGVVTVLVFYFFHGRKWWCLLGQFACLYYLNVEILGGYYYNVDVFGMHLEVVQQGLALFALIPIWLYRGRQGYHAKWFQYACYAFYPAHLLILYLIWHNL